MIQTKRIYESPAKNDGYRVLIDRLWPRGISKEKARINEWMREIAPSNELRRWYRHDPAKWKEFQKRYLREMKEGKHVELFHQLKKLARGQQILTLVFSSREEKLNNATVLKELLESK